VARSFIEESWDKAGTERMFDMTTTDYFTTSYLQMDEMKVVGSFSVTRLQNK
jgi:hypothetical protein